MEEEFQINEYETLPKEPLFKPEPPKFDNLVTPETMLLADGMRAKATEQAMSGAFDFDTPDYMGTMGKDQRIQLRGAGPGLGKDVYQELSDGTQISRFETYNPAISTEVQENLFAQQQSGAELFGKMWTRLGSQTGINILGGIAGTVNGFVQAIRLGSMDAFYDNDFTNYLEDLRKKDNMNQRVYTPAGYEDLNFGQKMLTGKFYADEIAGGVSFLAGTVISEGIWAFATGGTGVLAKGAMGAAARVGIKANVGKNIQKITTEALISGKGLLRNTTRTGKDFKKLRDATIQAKKIQDGFNIARFTATATGYEASIESLGYLEEVEAEFVSKTLAEEGRLPTAQEMGDFRNEAVNGANGVFWANMGLVGFSNYTILGRLALGRNTTKPISSNFFKKHLMGIGFTKGAGPDKLLVAAKANKAQKAFRRVYSAGKGLFTEGVIEEGGQSVASKTVSDYVLSGLDAKNTEDTVSFLDSFRKGLVETYTTKQGLTEVGLGALIGILGGGVSSGFKFNEYSNQAKQIEGDIKFVNSYSNKKLIEQMIATNQISRAVRGAEQAREKGDLTEEMSFDTAAITALVESKSLYEGTDTVVADFMASLESIPNAELAKQMNMTEAEVQAWKQTKGIEFKNIAEEHTKNIEFANALIGEMDFAGIDGIQGFPEMDGITINRKAALRSAVAFSLTMGKRSDEWAQSLAMQMKQLVGKGFSGRAVDAIEANEALRKIDNASRTKLAIQSRRKKALAQEVAALENALVEAQNEAQLSDAENANTKKAKVVAVQKKLLAAQESYNRIEIEQNLAVEALNLQNLDGMPITAELLDNQEENVKDLQKAVEALGQSNPEFRFLMDQLINEYDRAVTRAKSFDNSVKAILDPKTRVSVLNGWLTSMVKKNKALNEETGQWFTDVLKNYYNGRINTTAQAAAKADKQQQDDDEDTPPTTPPVDENQNPLDNPPENVAEEIAKDQTTRQEAPQGPTQTDVVQKIQSTVNELVEGDFYAKSRFSGVEGRIDEVVPTQKEIDEYHGLLKKAVRLPNPADIALDESLAKRAMGLSDEDFKRFKELNTKLNNWQLLSASTEIGSSVAELLTLAQQVQKGFVANNVKIQSAVSDFIIFSEAKEADPSGATVKLNTIITPDIVTAKKTGGQYQLSHLKPTSLQTLFPNAKVTAVVNGRPVNIDTIPKEKLDEMSRTPGAKFQVQVPGPQGRATYTVDERQRLLVSEQSFEADLPFSTMRVLDFGTTNFMPVFNEVSPGVYKPLEGDFIIESIDDNEIITMDKNALYGMSQGTLLRAVVNMNDSYNAELKRKLDDGVITMEEFQNELHIYLATERATNDIVGVMRAIKPGGNEKSATFGKMHFIRRMAAKNALASSSPRTDVGVTIPLGGILLGTPRLQVEQAEDGTLSARNIALTPQAIEQIVDYGYAQDTEISSKENLQLSEENRKFVVAAAKRNPGQKIPFIVFNYRGRNIAFPVSLKSGQRGLSEVEAIAQKDISEAAKIKELNDLAQRANIDFTQFPISDLSSEEGLQLAGALSTAIAKSQVHVDLDSWMSDAHTKESLGAEVEIAIDITDNPFSAPKGLLTFSEIALPTEVDMEVESTGNLDNYARRIENIFRETEPFRDMVENTKFYDAFYAGSGINMSPESWAEERRNANMLVEAFSHPLSKSVKEALGQDLIDNVRKEIKMFKLITKGIAPKTKYQKEVESELNKLKNECE
jgi:hypothetical protein